MVEMQLIHTRHQLPVGQGGFHVGNVYLAGVEAGYEYVYDSGANPSKNAVKRQVKSLLAGRPTGKSINALFISHLDVDHVNGLEFLLAKSSGVSVEKVFLPYVSPAERLLLAAKTPSSDHYVRRFLLNPTQTLLESDKVEQVVYVMGDGHGGPEHQGEGPERQWPNPGDREAIDDPRTELPATNEGSDPLETTAEIRGQAPGDSDLVAESERIGRSVGWMRHETPVVVGHPRCRRLWILQTYVQPSHVTVGDIRAEVERRIGKNEADRFVRGSSECGEVLSDPGNRKSLRDAYRALFRNGLNGTSLSLFSGPICANQWAEFPSRGHPGWGCCVAFPACIPPWARTDIGWLATGDSEIGKSHGQARKRLLAFFRSGCGGNLLKQVHTLVLPHHGSAHNYDDELLLETHPSLTVACAGERSRYGHPHRRVIESVAFNGYPMVTVTELSSTGLTQVFRSR